MRRRDFIMGIGGSAAVWPLAARAQQAMPVIGYLGVRAPTNEPANDAAFRRGLAEHGYAEGQNVRIEYRLSGSQYDRFPALAAELAGLPVNIFVTSGNELPALAARAANPNIPIVFIVGSDPVKLGLVASDNRPGGNATGVNILTNSLAPKRLGLLHDMVPQALTVGVLTNPNFRATATQLSELREAAGALRLKLLELRARSDQEIEAAFEEAALKRTQALAVAAEPFSIPAATRS